MLKSKILFIMTGSIACFKACAVLSKLKQAGHSIKVVMSPSSLQFVGAATIEGLTGEAPITDMYTQGQIMDHINLNRWADLVIVAPATANYINKIAYGLGDDLLTTLFLAHDFKKPFLVTPAMNTMMYLHPTTQASIKKLKEMNVEILETASGVLACGEVGHGRLLEPELIVQEIEKRLNNTSASNSKTVQSQAKQIKVLITSGGTVEPIDDVRVITNTSTGKTGAQIASDLTETGISVTYLHAESAAKPEFADHFIAFTQFSDLSEKLEQTLKQTKYDWVIHLAAVSDYSVIPTTGKIDSSENELTLKLKKNPKLIEMIKRVNPNTQLVGFKLTSTTDTKLIEQKVATLFEKAHCDFVVQNNWSDIKNNLRQFSLYSGVNEKNPVKISNVNELSSILFQKMIEMESL
ncbi:MAG: bifunctional phosphopantothenoylcysteine decarboxylase/phosphopantothenate--cysteine ligase CoaBC [Bdellovibrio sp.]|nr:bifunctional phosphopantothenoylcysteine decarboxylase/phosphopantothenate--cysteine ligase CoaBC [Bdellovibrio sp.]